MSGLRELRRLPGEVGWRRQLLRALLLVLVPSMAAIGIDLVRPDGLPLIARTDYVDEILVPCPENLREAAPIDIDALPLSVGELVFVDARTSGEHLTWHLPGALSIPHRPLRTDDTAYERELARDLAPLEAIGEMPIVVCGDARMSSGRDLAALLLEQGFPDVRYLAGGCAAWEEAGRPVERGEAPVVRREVAELPPELEGLTVVDARFSRYFRRGHLPGATCIPYAMLGGPEDERLDVLRGLPGDRLLVYGSASREEGEALAGLLAANGWPGVAFLAGGFEAWEAAGRSVEPPRPSEASEGSGEGAGSGEGTGTTGQGRPR